MITNKVVICYKVKQAKKRRQQTECYLLDCFFYFILFYLTPLLQFVHFGRLQLGTEIAVMLKKHISG